LGAFVAGTHLWLWLMIVRANMGILTTPLHPGCARAVGLWIIGPRQTFANGLVTGAALLGIACTPLFFGALIDLVGWPIAFVITGSCTAALAAIWLTATRRLDTAVTPQAARTRDNWSDLLRSRSLWLLTLSYAAIGYFQYLFFYWMHYYFDHVLKWGTQESRNAAAAPVFAMALTMPLGGWLSQRFETRYGWRAGRVFLASAGMLGAVVFLVIGVAADSWKVAWFTLALGSLGLSEAAFWQTAVELGGKRGGTAAAVMNTGGNGIGLLAPIVTPWVAGQHGWKAGITLGAAVCFVGAVCWLWIFPPPAKNEAEIV
jgi:MFS family permease